MAVRFVGKPRWPRSLTMPRIRKSTFGNSSRLFSSLFAKCSMPLSVTGCDGLQRRPGTFVRGSSWHVIFVDRHPMITVQQTSLDPMERMPTRSTAAIEGEAERSGTLPVEDPPTVTAQFRPLDAGIVSEAIPHFLSAATRMASGLPVTLKGRSAESFCFRTQHCRLREGIARRRDAQQYSHPRGSNSTWKTKAIHLSRIFASGAKAGCIMKRRRRTHRKRNRQRLAAHARRLRR